ncbi:MAG: hypothetical protein ACLTYN_01750 [Dysosmobacter welbionis]
MVEFQRKDFYSYEDFLEIMRLLRAPGAAPGTGSRPTAHPPELPGGDL